jgi:hypothetical protein
MRERVTAWPYLSGMGEVPQRRRVVAESALRESWIVVRRLSPPELGGSGPAWMDVWTARAVSSRARADCASAR